MKKRFFKNIVFTITLCIGMCIFGTTVNGATITKDYQSYYGMSDSGEPEYIDLFELTISSDAIEEDWTLGGHPHHGRFTIANDDYQLYSEYLYSYNIMENEYSPANPVGEFDILVSQDGIVEGKKYDVYYLDLNDVTHQYEIDENNLSSKAEVKKINNKLYISFKTTVLKPFILCMHMSQEYKEELDKITTNGFYTFPGVKPTRTINDYFDFYTYFAAFEMQNHNIKILPVDEYELEKEYQLMTLEFDSIPNEVQIMKYKWDESAKAKILQEKVSEIEAELNKYTREDALDPGFKRVFFDIEDLNYINYLKNSKSDDYTNAINYSTDLKRMLKNTNYKYYFDFRAGSDTLFGNMAFGFMNLSYDGIIVPLSVDAGYLIKQVVYIPDNTLDTSEAFLEAAKKRIKEYLGEEDFTLEIGGLISEIEDEDGYIESALNNYYNVEKMDDNYYILKIGNKETKIVLEKNSAEIANMEYKIKDLLTDVEISTQSIDVPYDSLPSVNAITPDSNEYKNILKKLGKNAGEIFDIKLFSESLNKYITKLSNGKFEVKIPIKEEFKSKDLSAFYINENNSVEEYPITIKDNYGIFITDHFSTYTISYATPKVDNPKTNDSIMNFIFIGSISLIGLLGTSIYLKKKRFN